MNQLGEPVVPDSVAVVLGGLVSVCSHGLAPVLAGRNAEAIRDLGKTLGLEMRAFGLADPAIVAEQLHGMEAVLHCAGPFSATSRPMLDGCLQVGTNHLDIMGEITERGVEVETPTVV